MKSPILILSLAAALVAPVLAATPAPAPQAEYKRADTNFYWKGDVLKVEPNAVILPLSGFKQQNDSYFISGGKKAPKVVYLQVVNDWVEPITPPGATSLGMPSNAIQIREPQGDVEVANPSAPASFAPARDGMTLANGTVVKTGANATAAVVFGGVASARLIPNSEAAVQQSLKPGLRSTEIDLTRGAIFSKVGKPLGEKEDYTVHTPFGTAAARGTDFVSVAMPARTDVWIAQGTVELTQTSGAPVGQISAEGTGPIKIIRFPLMPDPHAAMMASAETMTAAMNFIPMANQKVKVLRDRLAKGEKLTDAETKYLGLIKKVPCLIKLALVPPPAPPPGAATTTMTAAPAKPTPPPSAPATTTTNTAKAAATPSHAVTTTTNAAPAPAKAAATPAPSSLGIHLNSDGTATFEGSSISLDSLKAKLADMARATPDEPVVIKASKKVPYDQVKQLGAFCRQSGFKNVNLPPAPAVSASTATPATKPAVTAPAPPSSPPLPVGDTPTSTLP